MTAYGNSYVWKKKMRELSGKKNVRVVLQRLLAKLNESWFKVSTAWHEVNEGAQFSENALYNQLVIRQKSFCSSF